MSISLLKAELSRSLRTFLDLDLLLTEADASLSSSTSSSSAIPTSCPTNEKLFVLLNRIQDGLQRLESAAEDSSTRGTLEPSLLSFLADSELNNPDAWLQQRLGEIIQDEKVALVRVAALQSISDALLRVEKNNDNEQVQNKEDPNVKISVTSVTTIDEEKMIDVDEKTKTSLTASSITSAGVTTTTSTAQDEDDEWIDS
jgi:alanyl-tRNA synthetase